MIEILAAAAGASISVAAMGLFGFSRRNEEASAAVIRLTSAVETLLALANRMSDTTSRIFL